MKATAKFIYVLFFFFVFAGNVSAEKNIVILSTNDTHSRIEPIPETDKDYGDMAGVVRRMEYINIVRKEVPSMLLFDAGDFVQGTPYFNLFGGRVETECMNMMKYDAGTLGNHEFDLGLDTLKRMVQELIYPIVNCNYDFSHTVLKGMIKPYVIFERNGVKIGVLGVGPDPKGLVQTDKYEGMIFNPIIESANKYAKILKDKEYCDLVVCLSHIGYVSHNEGDVIDPMFAEQSRNIDIIIGAHSHTYLEKPVFKTNLDGKQVMITQTGKNASYVNRIDVTLK